MQIQEEILILIAKHLKGETSPEEAKRLDLWLKESDQNVRAYEELKFLWNSGKKDIPLAMPDVDKAWMKVKGKAKLGQADSSQEKGKIRSLFGSYFLKVAASLVLVLLAGYFLNKQFEEDLLVEISSGNQKKEVILPDGSKIYLNKNSAIAYSQKKFNDKERVVFMEGEVFFEVKRDTTKPFIVQGVLSTTKVLGTSFQVRSFSADSMDEVQVVEGKVSFQVKDREENKVVLLPGEKASLLSGKLPEKAKVENFNSLAWQTGELNFENASLTEVAQAAEDYFDIEIKIADSHLSDCRFTGSFVKPQPEELIKILSVSMNLSWQKTDSAYVLAGEGCK